MGRRISIENQYVDYEVRRSNRAKRMRIAVYCGGAVVVTLPYSVEENSIEKFLYSKTEWILSKVGIMSKISNRNLTEYTKEHYAKYKKAAQDVVVKKVSEWNELFGFSFNEIRIKDHKTKWGSCSRKGNLNFNYKILFLTEKEQDYIVVHELCHLKEMNHSRKYWSLVEKAIPNHIEIRKRFVGLS